VSNVKNLNIISGITAISLSVTGDKSVVFSGYSGFSYP